MKTEMLALETKTGLLRYSSRLYVECPLSVVPRGPQSRNREPIARACGQRCAWFGTEERPSGHSEGSPTSDYVAKCAMVGDIGKYKESDEASA